MDNCQLCTIVLHFIQIDNKTDIKEIYMIRIVIDSGTDINEALLDLYGETFEFIPLSVILDEVSYTDQVDITLSEVHEYMNNGQIPKTSQISPKAALDTFQSIASNGDDMIYLSLGSALSGTYQVGMNALREVKDMYPDFKGAVVDSKSAAGLLTVLYIQAQELIAQGKPFETIVDELEWCANHGVTFLGVDDINWLAKGGRLPKTIGTIGSMLKVKPFLTLDEMGAIVKKALIRGKDRVYTKMVEETVNILKDTPKQIVVISHVGRIATAEKIKGDLQAVLADVSVLIAEVSPVVAAHIGIGGVGIFFLNAVTDNYHIPEELT